MIMGEGVGVVLGHQGPHIIRVFFLFANTDCLNFFCVDWTCFIHDVQGLISCIFFMGASYMTSLQMNLACKEVACYSLIYCTLAEGSPYFVTAMSNPPR